MNANAYGGELARALEWVDVVSAAGTARRAPGELGFAYRRSNLGPGEIVARASFALERAASDEVKATLADMRASAARRPSLPGSRRSARRSRTRPTRAPRAAPPGSCSRRRAAAACASAAPASRPSTPNFVENHGEATTADVIALMAEGRPAGQGAVRRRARARGPGARPGRPATGPRMSRLGAGRDERRAAADGSSVGAFARGADAACARLRPVAIPRHAPAAAPAGPWSACLCVVAGAAAARRGVAVAARLLAGRRQAGHGRGRERPRRRPDPRGAARRLPRT